MIRLAFAAVLLAAAAPAGARLLEPEIVKVDLERPQAAAAPEASTATVVVSSGAAAGFAAAPQGAWLPKGFRTISYMPGEGALP